MRADGDVKFTMVVSLATTIGARLVFSLLFAIVMNMGVIGYVPGLVYPGCDFLYPVPEGEMETVPIDMRYFIYAGMG